MKYLNLTKGFTPIRSSSRFIEFENFTFKGGEPHIKIKVNTLYENRELTDIVCITLRIESFNDMGMLLLAVDALRRIKSDIKLELSLPYFPGARQDRVMVQGEPLTVKIYADLINGLNFQKVSILDPHSDVTVALLNNVNVIPNYQFVLNALRYIYPQAAATPPVLISPDAGANKKINNLAKYLSKYNKLDVVKCDKTRDVATGEITKFEVYSYDLNNRDCIIVDDICDGGGTFLGLAKELYKKHAGHIYLIVTHGIFSKGLDILSANFSDIYTTDSFDILKYNNTIPSNVHQIKIKFDK